MILQYKTNFKILLTNIYPNIAQVISRSGFCYYYYYFFFTRLSFIR